MFVIFLRAVNLGARNKVPTRPLAERLSAELGVPVVSHLQSGNLVVGGGERAALASLTSRLIREDTGLEIPAIVRSRSELESLLDADPWPEEDPIKVHLSMWDESHDPDAAAAMAASDWAGDEIAFAGSNAWLHFARSFHAGKLGNQVIERRLRVTATARNAQTIRTVADLAAQFD